MFMLQGPSRAELCAKASRHNQSPATSSISRPRSHSSHSSAVSWLAVSVLNYRTRTKFWCMPKSQDADDIDVDPTAR